MRSTMGFGLTMTSFYTIYGLLCVNFCQCCHHVWWESIWYCWNSV